MDYFKDGIRKYATFSGRATRTQYWMFSLGTLVLSIAAGILGGILASVTHVSYFSQLSNAFSLFVLIPSFAVGARRLHDTSRSGWWLLLNLIPIIGWIWLLVLYCIDSTPGANEYGVNQKEVAAGAPVPAQSQVATPAPAPAPEVPTVAPVAQEPTEPPTVTPGASLG